MRRGSSSSATAACSSSRPCSSSPRPGWCCSGAEARGPSRCSAAPSSVAFLVLELGYYDPYGGDSPGPRFFIPALPFLALGLAPAFARWRVVTALFAAASVLASTAVLLTWPAAVNAAAVYRWSVWRELALFLRHGSSSELAQWTQKTVASWLGAGRLGGAAIVLTAALGALFLALSDGWRTRRRS